MKKLMQTILSGLLLLQVNLAFAHKSPAEQLRLEAMLGQPIMLAGKKQLGYLQVSLTGFKLPSRQDRAPVNIAIVIDKSGSMQGEKLPKPKKRRSWQLDV